MAVVETMKKVAANLQLQNGTDDKGNMKYVSLSFGTLAKDSWDADKLMNVKNALAPCLSKIVGYTQAVKTMELAQQ